MDNTCNECRYEFNKSYEPKCPVCGCEVNRQGKLYDKDKVYDEKIAPKMAEIIKICKEEGIPFNAQFYLQQQREDAEFVNQATYCSTVIPCADDMHEDHKEHMRFVAESMRYGKNGRPFVMAMTMRGE